MLKMRFERSGRGQEPSRGHKFSILENFLSIRDFTSQTLARFPSDLVGACLPQTLLMVRTLRCERTACRAYITSPRSYRTDRRYNDQNECSINPQQFPAPRHAEQQNARHQVPSDGTRKTGTRTNRKTPSSLPVHPHPPCAAQCKDRAHCCRCRRR